MRTRIYNKCTDAEITDYLNRGGDTLFMSVGVTELHGQLPVDCESILAEAAALLMAEKADGLAVINLPSCRSNRDRSQHSEYLHKSWI